MFLGNYLIGLREGLEAALVVSILIAYLVKTGNRRALVPVWTGVGIAVALSVAFGLALQFLVAQENHFKIQELTGGILSIVAVGLVTWMVFWMRSAARGIKAELEGRLDSALDMGPRALTVVAFLAVGREGLETALFLWTNIAHSNGSPVLPVTGAFSGLLTAVLLGYLLYRGGLNLNLQRFFKWTGAALVIVAAGVLGIRLPRPAGGRRPAGADGRRAGALEALRPVRHGRGLAADVLPGHPQRHAADHVAAASSSGSPTWCP